MYPTDYHDKEKAGKPYIPGNKDMLVMNSAGVFFLYNGEPFYPSIRKLSDVIYKYDVVWSD
jgi:hypothetical protein